MCSTSTLTPITPVGLHDRRDEEELVEALVAGIAGARERIDLRRHDGVHPRVGVADVVPVVAVWPEQMERGEGAALAVAGRVGDELGLPVFLYGELAPGVRPAFSARRPRELRRRVEAGELTPDCGPRGLDPAAGCVLVGARRPLIAFNVDLDTDDLGVAREIAAVVRETGGGFPGVRALGFPLASRGIVQVSMNVEDGRLHHSTRSSRGSSEEARERGVGGARCGARRAHTRGRRRRGGAARPAARRRSSLDGCSSCGCSRPRLSRLAP